MHNELIKSSVLKHHLTKITLSIECNTLLYTEKVSFLMSNTKKKPPKEHPDLYLRPQLVYHGDLLSNLSRALQMTANTSLRL